MRSNMLPVLVLTFLMLAASGCGSSSTPAATPRSPTATQVLPSATPLPINTPTATEASAETPTETPSPTETGTPTPMSIDVSIDTPTDAPTAEPTPTPTQTPMPTPAPPPSGTAPGDTWTRPVDDMTMVYLPAAQVELGSDEAEIDAALEQCERDRDSGGCGRDWFEDEAPRHAVDLETYWIDRTEVTNEQFAAFLNALGNQVDGGVAWLEVEDTKSPIELADGQFRPKDGLADHPVIKVSWHGALAYCDWVGGELPTEAQWEYAARGPERYAYPWGDEAPPTCQQANSAGCQGSPLPVGSLPEGASWSGALDMAGNVWEWVYNWYLPYPGSEHENEDYGRIFKVVRGGSWKFEPYYVRAAQRNLEYMPDVRSDQIGFRCVVSVEE